MQFFETVIDKRRIVLVMDRQQRTCKVIASPDKLGFFGMYVNGTQTSEVESTGCVLGIITFFNNQLGVSNSRLISNRMKDLAVGLLNYK